VTSFYRVKFQRDSSTIEALSRIKGALVNEDVEAQGLGTRDVLIILVRHARLRSTWAQILAAITRSTHEVLCRGLINRKQIMVDALYDKDDTSERWRSAV
jgi:hypothetical protein